MAVERVRDGERPSSVIASFGFNRTTIYRWLEAVGLTPQKPLQRAYQRDPAAIEKWQREQFPAIARQAKASGGEVYFWDESGFRADAVHGKTWGRKG